jgi:hypothetical protein
MTDVQFSVHSDIAEARFLHKRRVDEKAGAVRQRFARDWLVDEEYVLAAEQAQTFADGGYIGDAPEAVQAWADAAGMTEQSAADDILATRDAYTGALEQIRRIRLEAKQRIAGVDTARAAYDIAEQAVSDLDAIAP